MPRVEITKSAFGRLRVSYDCPNCRERLRSSLTDAGKPDSCPNCHVQFTVPGIDALNQENERKQAESKSKAEAIARERERRRQEEEEFIKARLLAKEEVRRQHQKELERKPDEPLVDTSNELQNESKGKNRRIVVSAVTAIIAFILISIVYSVSTKSGAGLADVVRSSGLRTKLKACPSYGIVEADAYYDGVISTDTVVFDLLDGGSVTARRIDAVHLLLQFSDELDLYTVRRIILARNGEQEFYISTSDMRPLAESYANGGRLWAFNHLPENLRTMSGLRSYDEWSGGLLGALQKQAEDLNDVLEKWLGYKSHLTDSFGRISSPPSTSNVSRDHVRKTLQEIEDNVPETLREMEAKLPDIMADMKQQMMRDAGKYGLSASEVREQLQEIEAAARGQIRGMESDVRQNIRDMEDGVLNELRNGSGGD